MKILLAICLLSLSTLVFGGEYVGPMHSPEEIVKAILKAEKLDPNNVKVMLLKYDYLKKEWHVELTPSNKTCVDCYPSYFLENTKPLKVIKIPHG